MKILITGGAGFIGSHLTERLLNDGNSVIVLDNFSTGTIRNLQHLLDDKNLEVLHRDVTEPFTLEVDRIYNLACPASPIQYQKDPVKTIMTSVMGIINCMETAMLSNARVLQASTSEIYGDPEEHPQKESYRGCVNTIGPRSCYDEGKRVAETLLYEYSKKYNLETRIARIFNTYGPKMKFDDGRMISNFIIQALCEEPITIFGDGSQTRSLCYVDDLVEGLIALMEHPQESGPVNLGNPDERTVKQIAELVLKLTSSSSIIAFDRLPQDDPKKRKPDTSLALKTLNWKPYIGVEQGIQKVVDYYRLTYDLA